MYMQTDSIKLQNFYGVNIKVLMENELYMAFEHFFSIYNFI